MTFIDFSVLLQVIFLDIILSGDNAIVIAMVVSQLPVVHRKTALLFGMILAIILRVLFSLGSVWLFQIKWLQIFGGLLLLFVAWKLYREIKVPDTGEKSFTKAFRLGEAIFEIIIADITMSLDNILAVSAASQNSPMSLVPGLVLSIALMGIGASIISKFLDRWPVLKYIGLSLIVYIGTSIVFKAVWPVIKLHI